MPTLRSIAALLAGAATPDRILPILRAIGFESAPEEVDITTRAALGIPSAYRDVRILRGAGSIRALLLTAPAHLPVREATTRLAARLATGAPHILWLLAIADPAVSEMAVAAWSGDRRPPRVAALVVRRDRVVDSDAETICALAAAHAPVDILTHSRWVDILGRESVTRRFYRTLERLVESLAASLPGRASADDRTELALLCVSRLLFLSFLEAKGWLDGDRGFLVRSFDACAGSGGAYHRRVLLPLLHGTLNTPRRARSLTARAFGSIPFLNGGLFARTPIERRHRSLLFPDDALGAVFGELLSRYRFTAREDSDDWSEASVDPEMMGRAFESIMASGERRSTGAYYTPRALVERITGAALTHALAASGVPHAFADALVAGTTTPAGPRARVRERIARLRVIDPACGSGAFLVHALERLAAMHVLLGDRRDMVEIRRDVLTRSIFGVDRSPFAVWLCELRLWLSMVIESGTDDPRAVTPLPNLDHHIRVGDALAGDGIAPIAVTPAAPAHPSSGIERLRARYVRATGRRKLSIARALDREERRRALALLDDAIASTAIGRRDLIAALRTRDLFGDRHRPTPADRDALTALRTRARDLRALRREARDGALPFSFATHFADAASAGGFDVVLGNPPWVRLHRIPAASRAAFRHRFAVFAGRGWTRGTTIAGAGSGFASQIDLAALFIERSVELLREGGVLSLLVPAKLWRSLAGGGVRRLLADATSLLEIDDLAESPHAFDAAVYPSILTASRGRPVPCRAPIVASRARHERDLRWCIDPARLGFDNDPASPWLIVPGEVRDAFDALTRAGTPLAESRFGRPHLGVKCGCNEAFIVSRPDAPIEEALLRPLIRGESVRAWALDPRAASDRLLWPHDEAGSALRVLPPLARQWLAPWRGRLLARTDGRGRGRWWSLFRIDAARCDLPRVVWADLGRAPRAIVLPAHDAAIPINTCYAVRCPEPDDAYALAALLNGPVAAAWTSIVAEPARGGFRRYLGWTMALLPLPGDWPRARSILAPLGERASRGERPTPPILLAAALDAYGLAEREVAPLLAWTSP